MPNAAAEGHFPQVKLPRHVMKSQWGGVESLSRQYKYQQRTNTLPGMDCIWLHQTQLSLCCDTSLTDVLEEDRCSKVALVLGPFNNQEGFLECISHAQQRAGW